MTAYVEWIEPLDILGLPVICRMSFKHVVQYQFKRHQEYASAERAIDDFLAVYWGRIVR